MKIAILGTRGIPNNYGGFEQFAEYLGEGLVRKGHQVTVYNPSLHPYKNKAYKGINIITKYIGDQFIDNTSSLDSKMDDYLTNTCRVTYNIRNKWLRTTRLTLQVNNILNNEYISNAWVYRFISDSWDPRGNNPYVNKNNERGYNMSGFFPEAKRNYLLGLSIGL